MSMIVVQYVGPKTNNRLFEQFERRFLIVIPAT